MQQIVESLHRVNYVALIRTRRLSARRIDPADELFDPLKGAILHQERGDTDEAFWLIFLSIHFGKHRTGGWRLVREVYGRLGEGEPWHFGTLVANLSAFRVWLAAKQAVLGRPGAGFGNHRKYESLDAHSPAGTGAVIESYVRWVDAARGHSRLIKEALRQANDDPHRTFDDLYRAMAVVQRFGRTARFDYLTMLSKLGLAAIEPGSPYMQGSTGPLRGARLLYGGDPKALIEPANLDTRIILLGRQLDVGMHVLEDALCNWQKSPDVFRAFRG